MKKILSYWPPLLWSGIILLLCSFPGKQIPHVSWLELLSFDKWVHAGIFFILALLCFRSLRKTQQLHTANKYITVILCVIYGGSLEIMQSTLFIDRSGDWYDFIANSAGSCMALWTIKWHTPIATTQQK